jgi:hypothetical protein
MERAGQNGGVVTSPRVPQAEVSELQHAVVYSCVGAQRNKFFSAVNAALLH